MDTMECDAPMESVASSPGAVVIAHPTDVVWIPDEYPAPSSTQDELDKLLEELARDTSCPYLQQLTVPNLMAAMLPHSGAYPVGSDLGPPQPPSADNQLQSRLQEAPQPQHSVWLAAGPYLRPCAPDELSSKAMLTATAGRLSCAADGRIDRGDAPRVVVPAVIEVRAAAAGQTSLAGMQTVADLTITKVGVSGSSSGGGADEWGESGNSQLCAHGMSLARDATACAAAAAAAATGSITGSDGGSGACCPAPPAMPCACLRRCTLSSEQAPVGLHGGCTDTANLGDQPGSKLWLSKSLRRLRSMVRMKGSSSGRGSGSGLHKPATSAKAACVAPTTGLKGGTAAAAAVPSPTDATAVRVSTPGRDVDIAGGTLDQLSYLRGSYGDTPSATIAAADSGGGGSGFFTFSSPVTVFAARLRALPSKRRSL